MKDKGIAWFNLALAAFTTAYAGAACTQPLGEAAESDDALPEAEETTGEAAQALTYACTLGASCAAPTVTQISNVYGATYKVNMAQYRRLDLFASVCSPTGWTLHLTDSPTANGWGGDGMTTDHDAEGYLYNGSTFQFFSAYEMTRGVPGAKVTSSNAFPGGCKTVRMAAFHASGSASSTILFEGDVSNPASATAVESPYGLKVGYTSCSSMNSPQRSVECDWENSGLSDKDYWYIGINRVVGSLRLGTGVQAACVVLSSDVNAVPSSCL